VTKILCGARGVASNLSSREQHRSRRSIVKKLYVIPLLAFIALCVIPFPTFAATILYEGFTPATANYVSSCGGPTYHGLHYCDFTDTFSVSNNRLAVAINWYDLGCNSRFEGSMTFFYDLADADTYQVIAESSQSVTVTCTPGYPVGHNIPTTLAIPPTVLAGGQHYFILLRASNNEVAEAYWGTDANHHDSFQVLDAMGPTSLVQLRSDGITPIAPREMISETSVALGGKADNATGNQVQIQIELRRLTETLTGEPTAVSGFVSPGQIASVPVFGLIDGVYHWRMRAADSQGNVSNWQEFGSPGSADFEVYASPLPATFAIPNPSCNSFVTFVPYAPMVLQGANFWTCCYDTPQSYIGCYGQAYSRVFDASGSTVLAQSDSIPSFGYTLGCGSDLNYTTSFSGANQITLQPGVAYTFRNVETDGSSCTPGPNHPNAAYLTVATPPSPSDAVVFVPGIMGSRLFRSIDHVEVWPNVDKMYNPGDPGNSYLDELKLQTDGSQRTGEEMIPDAIIHGLTALGRSSSFYQDILDDLRSAGYSEGINLFTAPFDWRLDVSTQTFQLKQAIDAALSHSRSGKISIVAHSFGGLLVKEFLRQQSTPPDYIKPSYSRELPTLGLQRPSRS
jgi:hypothetical protein